MVKKLAQLRNQKGMTQEEMAKLLGVKQTTISGWENGTREPKHEMVVKIAEALEVDWPTLYGDA